MNPLHRIHLSIFWFLSWQPFCRSLRLCTSSSCKACLLSWMLAPTSHWLVQTITFFRQFGMLRVLWVLPWRLFWRDVYATVCFFLFPSSLPNVWLIRWNDECNVIFAIVFICVSVIISAAKVNPVFDNFWQKIFFCKKILIIMYKQNKSCHLLTRLVRQWIVVS